MSIEDWRRKIDEIDRKLVELLNERSKCAIEIGRIKRAQNLRVYDPEREQEILERVKETNSGPLDNHRSHRLFERIIDACRQLERRVRNEEITRKEKFPHSLDILAERWTLSALA